MRLAFYPGSFRMGKVSIVASKLGRVPILQLVWSALAALSVVGCSVVSSEDMQSWVGRPVADLDRHPVFLTMTVVKTRTEDGTEMRNYVNGGVVASCSGGGNTSLNGYLSLAQYNSFSSCSQSFAGCHNIFVIKSSIVQQYSPIGRGGARCYTDDSVRPGFTGAVNVR